MGGPVGGFLADTTRRTKVKGVSFLDPLNVGDSLAEPTLPALPDAPKAYDPSASQRAAMQYAETQRKLRASRGGRSYFLFDQPKG